LETSVPLGISPSSADPEQLTRWLSQWNAGDVSVEPALIQVLYPALRALAQTQLSRTGPITMQATELANEAFIRLRSGGSDYTGTRFQFMNFVARMMRTLVLDHIRDKSRFKRGGEFVRVRIEELNEVAAEEQIDPNIDWVALDLALSALEKEDASYARLVELRYFLGYDMEQCARQLGVSIATANRMWRFSRAFLSARMRSVS
jgi:RNA polymerase sigma factor (TIGR02999 family)